MFSFTLLFVRLGVQDIDTTDLKPVIKELSSKFVYSLIGVLASIIWSWNIKKEQGEIELKSSQKDWKQKDPHELLWLILQTNLDATNKFQAYTLSQNKNHNGISEILNSHAREIRKQLEALNSNTLNLKTAIEDSAETQSENASNQQETLDNIHDFMEKAGDSLKNLLDDLKNQLENNLKTINSNAYSSVAEKTAEFYRVFENFLKEQSDKMADNIMEVQEKIQPALNSISEATNLNATELKSSLENVNNVLGDLKSSLTNQVSEQFSTSENNLQKLNEGLQQSIDRILGEKEEQIRKTFEHLEGIRMRSETALSDTTQKFSDSVNQFALLQDNNKEIIAQIKTQIESIHSLQTTSEKQIEHWNIRTDEMIELKNRVADIANTIELLDSLNHKLGLSSQNN